MTYHIKFKNLQVTELTLKVGSFDKNVTEKFETNFQFATAFSKNNNKKYAIIYKLHLQEESNKFELKLKATAHFETDEEINEDFKKSVFTQVNSPAISFPYLRAFVGNFTLNSGFEPIMLPTFNFVKMYSDKGNSTKKSSAKKLSVKR